MALAAKLSESEFSEFEDFQNALILKILEF